MNQHTCIRCQQKLDPTDKFCRNCGAGVQTGVGFFYSHTGIILLSLLLGPFALPAVWISKTISKTAKWIYTAVLTIIGLYLIKACYHIFLLTMDLSQQIMGTSF